MKFVFDLDGTLTFDGRRMPEVIQDALKQAQAAGHEVIFATARSYRDCLAVLGDDFKNHLVIALNGGLAYYQGKCILEHRLPQQVFMDLVKWSKTYNLPYIADNCFDYSTYLGQKLPFIQHVDPLKVAEDVPAESLTNPIKVVLYMGDHEELVADVCDDLRALGNLDLAYHEEEKCLYINPAGINKATTVLDFCGADFVVFGNDKNDKELFKAALYAVQVGTYKPLTKYADEQILHDDEVVQAVAKKIVKLSTAFQQ